ncbi:MAG: dolichyl-phosphate beta-glucosyltransferase [Dehalococcoidia bacterium]
MAAAIDIVVPVYNEEAALPTSIKALTGFLTENVTNPWKVTIADNASTDSTQQVSTELRDNYAGVGYLYLPQKGRGRALRTAWLQSEADIVGYMDADLSTDLGHLPQLIEALESGYHLAVGSRLSKDSQTTRGLQREMISRCYNLMIRSLFFTSFPDAQCGFKALTRTTAQALVPHIVNNNWFFDTELLILAAKRGYRIKSVPVKWVDDPTSTVHVVNTATEDIKGLLRLRFGGIPAISGPDTVAPQD